MLRGLPASGKSTWAKEQVDKGGGKVKRINKDDLRAMVDNGKWSKGNERDILDIRDRVISYFLVLGKTVIVDDTNLDPKHEKSLREIADTFNAEFTRGNFDDHRTAVEFEIKDFDTDVDECILRDAGRPNPVGKKVILDMYNRYILPKQPKFDYDAQLDFIYLCDIDGTIALHNGRSPYDETLVSKDEPNIPVARTIVSLVNAGCIIAFVSGRHEGYRTDTSNWITKWLNIKDPVIFMRKDEDMRADYIVKKELYEENIKGKYNVVAIFDDREQVVKMWRKLGLTVFQVAEGKF